MYVIKPHQAAVSLFSRDGLVRKFESMAEAFKHLGYAWISANVGRYFREYRAVFVLDKNGYEAERQYNEKPYILLDEAGGPLTAGDFNDLSKKSRRRRRYVRALWSGTGPVPYTRKRRGGGGWYRHPATNAIHRDALNFGIDGAPAPRAKRNFNGIPSARDGLSRSDYGRRSWKDYRDTQWKQRKG